MFKILFARLSAIVFLALATFSAPLSASEHPSIKRPFNLPPSADLSYAIKAGQGPLMLKGDSQVHWATSANRFVITVDTQASMLGKILESRSEGVVDGFGLAPTHLTEKRFRKPQHTVTYGRDDHTIRFSESANTYPIKGGEQDRTSITWQLVSIARGTPEVVKAGLEWQFFVVGRSDGESWTFKVIGRETIHTAMGDVTTIHISKLPSNSKGQQLDLWLAPSLEWYPVRMLYSEPNGTQVDQVLEKITKK